MQQFRIEKHGEIFRIWEVRTEQYLDTCSTREAAKALVKKYNSGMGFNGFTPAHIATYFDSPYKRAA